MMNFEQLNKFALNNDIPPVPEYAFPVNTQEIDFGPYFHDPANEQVKSKIITMGIKKILTSSANGYRGASDEALAKFVGVDCRFVPGISDELEWGIYKHYCEILEKRPNVLDYQKLVATSKYFRVRAATDEHLQTHGVVDESSIENHTLFIATDTIIWYWTGNGYLPMEKPKDVNDAVFQAWTLSRGAPFVLSNTTWTGMMSGRFGREANSTHLQPLRFDIRNQRDGDHLADVMLDEYKRMSSGSSDWSMVPGVLTKTHPDLARHLIVGMAKSPNDHVLDEDGGSFYMPRSTIRWNMYKQGDQALKMLVDHKLRQSEIPFLSLSPEYRIKVGLAVGGVSLDGKMEAIRRLPMQSVGYSNTNRSRERALFNLNEKTTFEDLPNAHSWA